MKERIWRGSVALTAGAFPSASLPGIDLSDSEWETVIPKAVTALLVYVIPRVVHWLWTKYVTPEKKADPSAE